MGFLGDKGEGGNEGRFRGGGSLWDGEGKGREGKEGMRQ